MWALKSQLNSQDYVAIIIVKLNKECSLIEIIIVTNPENSSEYRLGFRKYPIAKLSCHTGCVMTGWVSRLGFWHLNSQD